LIDALAYFNAIYRQKQGILSAAFSPEQSRRGSGVEGSIKKSIAKQSQRTQYDIRNTQYDLFTTFD